MKQITIITLLLLMHCNYSTAQATDSLTKSIQKHYLKSQKLLQEAQEVHFVYSKHFEKFLLIRDDLNDAVIIRMDAIRGLEKSFLLIKLFYQKENSDQLISVAIEKEDRTNDYYEINHYFFQSNKLYFSFASTVKYNSENAKPPIAKKEENEYYYDNESCVYQLKRVLASDKKIDWGQLTTRTPSKEVHPVDQSNLDLFINTLKHLENEWPEWTYYYPKIQKSDTK